MSKRLIGAVILALMLVTVSSGCTWWWVEPTATKPATTTSRPVQRSQIASASTDLIAVDRTGTFWSYTTAGGAPAQTDTGSAIVILSSSGTAVGATCQIAGLVNGDAISIQQYADSVWIVTGKL